MKLFVSYRSKDSSKVDPIVHKLRSLNLYEVWQDKYSIRAGQDWWKEICKGIEDCDVFVFMLSEESVKSYACLAELKYAYALNVPIIPFVIEGQARYESNGKYSISFWDDVPQELTNLRAQFLFYEGVTFLDKLKKGIEVALSAKQPRTTAYRPVDPRDATDGISSPTIMYNEACDFALRGEFETAKGLFRKLFKSKTDYLGDWAYQWYEMIGYYEKLQQIATGVYTRKHKRDEWEKYTSHFPTSYLDEVFDPANLKAVLNGKSKSVSSEQDVIEEHSESAIVETAVDELTSTPIDEKLSSPPEENSSTILDVLSGFTTLFENYTTAKSRGTSWNIANARSILQLIAQVSDRPLWFDVDAEDMSLRQIEAQLAEEERLAKIAEEERQRQAKITAEYEQLERYIPITSAKAARISIERFNELYPDYGDPNELRKTYCPNSEELLPEPFEWIKIAGGHGTMKTTSVIVDLYIPTEDYWIAKYPVTNAQFAEFINAEGYHNKHYWTKDGWKIRQDNNWSAPQYWFGSYKQTNNPVRGVNWYEAIAFCMWLREKTGERIILPTEAHWQYAAQGNDGRNYPWGDGWANTMCNNAKQPTQGTSAVTAYEYTNVSPFGVVDMVGNVGEWCLTDYHDITNNINSPSDTRVIRGGYHFTGDKKRLQCNYRSGHAPDFKNATGFRIVKLQN